MSKLSVRQRIFLTLTDQSYSSFAYFISVYFDCLTALSMITMCGETVALWNQTAAQHNLWRAIEFILTGNFLADFVLKLATAPDLIQYILTRAIFWIDILGLAPIFAELLVGWLSFGGSGSGGGEGEDPLGFSLKSLRVLRLLRFFRLSRIAYENFPDVRLFIRAVRRSKLALLFLGMYVFGGGLFFASCIYFAETASCSLNVKDKVWYYTDSPDEPCVIQDMFQAWWYTLVTMTTVGYGDVVVRSGGARIFTVLVMVASLVFLALPSAIFAANLTEIYLERRLERVHSNGTGHRHRSHSRKSSSHASSPAVLKKTIEEASPSAASEDNNNVAESEQLIRNIQSATEKVNAGMTAIASQLAFIQVQQRQLEALLRSENKG